MTFNLYSATHKTWDHVGNITPVVEYSEATRPHGEYVVADWLPVSRLDKYYEHYFVVSCGKIVAFDRTGRVVPAGLKTAFAVTSGDVLTYSATDELEGVIDLTTGVACAAGGWTRSELTTALLARGLIDAGEYAEDFISFPVGVAPYNYLQWAGGDGFNPAQERLHNYNMQSRVAILCKYVVQLPVVPAAFAGFNISGAEAISDSAIVDWDEDDAQGAWFSSTALGLTTRYASDVSAGDDIVCWLAPVLNLAKNTVLTPIVLPTGFTREVASIAEIVQAGDYFIDYEVGAILMFETDGNAAAVASGTVSFYHYDSAPTSVSTYACAVGDLKPGDFVRADANSNFCKARVFAGADADVVEFDDGGAADLAGALNLVMDAQAEIVGQVLDLEYFPKDYLERVRTAYPQLGTLDQMPGSASGGLPAAITYAGASNKMVRILLLK